MSAITASRLHLRVRDHEHRACSLQHLGETEAGLRAALAVQGFGVLTHPESRPPRAQILIDQTASGSQMGRSRPALSHTV